MENRSITFVYGSDDFIVDRRARFIFEGSGGGEIFTVDGSFLLGGVVKNAILSIATMPLFSDDCTIWLRSVDFIGDGSAAGSEAELLGQLIDAVKSSAGRKIIISSATVDRRTKIFKELVQISEGIDVGSDGSGIEATIHEFARDSGARIEDGAVQLLRMKCGNNSRLLQQEIRKLATFVGGSREISEEDVGELVDDGDPGNFFETVEKFFDGNLAATLAAIDRYFFCNGEARPLLAALQSRARVLIQLRAALQSGRIRLSGDGIARGDFPKAAQFFHMDGLGKSTFNLFSQNTWYLSKLVKIAAKLKLNQLLKLQSALFKAFGELIEHCQKSTVKTLAIECFALQSGNCQF
jgi:DNA polymerase-3 subunit delta